MTPRSGPAVDRFVRGGLLLVSASLLIAAVSLDLPFRSRGRFWSDGSTYLGMAGSLAQDGDLQYEARDLSRLAGIYPTGPQGLFLKRIGGDLFYGKSLLYPLVSVPFVWVLGPLGGLLALNVFSFGVALLLGYSLLRGEGFGAWAALALSLSLFGLTIAPLYLVWLTPEIFSLGLVTLGLWLFRRGHGIWASVVMGLLGYAKPTNALLALPLLLAPLVEGWESRRVGGLIHGARSSVVRALVVAGCVALGFLMNVAFTGEANYQGGDRKTFYGHYPFEAPGVGFEETGIWMSTEHVGPLVEGRNEADQTMKTGPVRGAEELRRSFVANLGYFWWGRFGGVVPYYLPVALGALGFLLLGPRTRQGWLALGALVVSWLVYIWLIPDNWYGGGGTVGNRYFLSLLPLALLIVPRRTAWFVAGGGAAFGAWALAPLLAAPVEHSLHPGRHTTSQAFRFFPAELTMLNDLSAFTDVWRKKRPYNGAEHGPSGDRGGEAPYFLYFSDNGTFGQEEAHGRSGFFLVGGASAEVILRAPSPVAAIDLRLTGGPGGEILVARVDRAKRQLVTKPAQSISVELRPGEGFPYYGDRLYVLRMRSRIGAATTDDPRSLGGFVDLSIRNP